MNRLKEEHKVLLDILEYFMHEREGYRLPENFSSFQELQKLSQEHSVAAIVYEIIHNDPLLQQGQYAAFGMLWKRMALQGAMLQIQKTGAFLGLYSKLCKAGLRPLVVKGAVCRNLYAKPDLRTSGDEDVLLSRSEFPLCDEILLKEGFTRDEVDLEHLPHEIPYINQRTGVYIELHLTLFPEEAGAYGHLNNEFEGVFDTCIQEEIQGAKVWTLEPTLHLFYLICHSFKHFLHSGFGIRQLCDIVMMAEHYGSQIRWSYLEQRLQALHMDGFWNGLVDIGQKQLGFSFEKAGYPEYMQKSVIDGTDLLADMLAGGVFGDSSMERKHSSNITLAAAEKGKKNTASSLKASLFPGMDYMKKNFSWLQKYPFLLPAAWVIRIWRYLKSRKEQQASEGNSVEIGIERVELMKKYGIID